MRYAVADVVDHGVELVGGELGDRQGVEGDGVGRHQGGGVAHGPGLEGLQRVEQGVHLALDGLARADPGQEGIDALGEQDLHGLTRHRGGIGEGRGLRGRREGAGLQTLAGKVGRAVGLGLSLERQVGEHLLDASGRARRTRRPTG